MRLEDLKLPIYVSELDLNIANDDTQEKRYKSLFPILWRNFAVRGVAMWGYKENHTWKPDTYLLRADGSERPALAFGSRSICDVIRYIWAGGTIRG